MDTQQQVFLKRHSNIHSIRQALLRNPRLPPLAAHSIRARIKKEKRSLSLRAQPRQPYLSFPLRPLPPPDGVGVDDDDQQAQLFICNRHSAVLRGLPGAGPAPRGRDRVP